jgi:hypothetical protein
VKVAGSEIVYSRVVSTYCAWHLGDNLTALHYLRSLAKGRPDFLFVHFLRPQDVLQCSELVLDIQNIQLKDITGVDLSGMVDLWKGSEGFYFKYDYPIDFGAAFLDFFDLVSKKIEIPMPFGRTDDLLFDYPAILVDRMVMPFDVLLVNSVPLSGQFAGFSEADFAQLARDLVLGGYSVVTTKKIPGLPCTLEARLTVTGIANLSLKCKYLIAVCTGSMWPSFNVFNNDSLQFKFVLNSHEIIDFGNNVVMCGDFRCLRVGLRDRIGL